MTSSRTSDPGTGTNGPATTLSALKRTMPVMLATLAMLSLATPALAKDSPWPGSGPFRFGTIGIAGNDDVLVDHTVQEDGLDLEGDLSAPPVWAGETDDFRSFMIPPEKLVPTLSGLEAGTDRLTAPDFLQPTLDPLGAMLEGGAGLDPADGWPSAAGSAGGAALDPGPTFLQEFQFDPSPSYAISYDEALAAGLIFADELADLALPVDDVNPFGAGSAAVPAPGALFVLGMAGILGRDRRRR